MQRLFGALAISALASGCLSDPVGSESLAVSSPATQDFVVDVDVTLVEVTPEVAARWIAPASRRAVVMPPEAERDLRASAGSGDDVAITSRPRIRVRVGARAEVSSTNEVDCIVDYGLDALMRPEPVREVVREGEWIAVRPMPAPRDALSLEVSVRAARLQRPIAEKIVRLGGAGTNVRVQVPVLDSLEFADVIGLALGETALMSLGETARAGPSDAPRRTTRLVLVHVERDPAR